MTRQASTVLPFALLAGLLCLVGCETGDLPQGRLVQATLVSCEPADALIDKQSAYWTERLQNPLAMGHERTGWKEAVPTLLKNYPGVVLHVQLASQAYISVYLNRGRAEHITVEEWRDVAESSKVFSSEFGGDCSNYPIGSTGYFLLGGSGSNEIPPDDLAGFLDIERLSRVPAVFMHYLPRDWRMVGRSVSK